MREEDFSPAFRARTGKLERDELLQAFENLRAIAQDLSELETLAYLFIIERSVARSPGLAHKFRVSA